MATPIPLLIPKTLRVTDEQFLDVVNANPDLRLERTAIGDVIELMSKTDDRETLQFKMQEYLEHGAQLGWLMMPTTRIVEIYRQQRPSETVSFETPLSGETVLPGFSVNPSLIF